MLTYADVFWRMLTKVNLYICMYMYVYILLCIYRLTHMYVCMYRRARADVWASSVACVGRRSDVSAPLNLLALLAQKYKN
jgi:hypothetical protein